MFNALKILRNDLGTLLLRLLIVYVLIGITQIIFYAYNNELIGTISLSELPQLIKGAFIFTNISVIYINSVFIILSLLPFRFRAYKWYQKVLQYIFIISNSIAVVVLNLADVIYFPFAQKRFTAEEFHFLQDNTNNSKILGTALLDYYWVIIIVGLLIWGMIFAYKKIPYYATNISKNVLYYPISAAILFGVFALSIGGVRGGFSHGLRPYTLSNAAFYAESPQKANVILSNPFCLFRSTEAKQLEVLHYFSEKELAQIYTPYHYPQATTKPSKKNVVVFILESFSKEHSKYLSPELYKNQNGYMPFLDSLMKEGLTFTNAFANGYKSIDALPSVFASIPSLQGSFVIMPQSISEINGLPKMLQNNGYHTSFFCGADKNSMGFESFGKLVGISNFYSREDYEKTETVSELTIEPLWGVYDMPFFSYFAKKVSTFPEPFFASMFNLTSHHPFKVPANYTKKIPKGHTKVQPCIAYTDMSFRNLFSAIKTEKWFNNTIFIFVADHPAAEKYAAQSKTPKGASEIVAFIYTPDKSIQGRYTSVFQQIDIMPTILGFLGNTKPFFAFGKNVMSANNSNHIVINNTAYSFQAISDSLTLYFNTKKTVMAYGATDTLQTQRLALNKPEILRIERYTKAYIQSYLEHVSKKLYVVPSQK